MFNSFRAGMFYTATYFFIRYFALNGYKDIRYDCWYVKGSPRQFIPWQMSGKSRGHASITGVNGIPDRLAMSDLQAMPGSGDTCITGQQFT